MDEARPLYLFYHMPKCAGTTLLAHLVEHAPDRLLLPRGRRGFLKEFGGGMAKIASLPADLDQIDVVGGHAASERLARAFPRREVRRIVMLRDPISFIVSMYNFRERQSAEKGWSAVPFEHFRRTLPKNAISRFLLLRYLGVGYPLILGLDSRRRLEMVERALASFWFVGSWRHVDALTAELSRRLGIPPAARRQNVSPEGSLSPAHLSEDIVAEIKADNQLDQTLFDRWKDALWSAQPASFDGEVPAWDQLSYLANDAGRHVWWRVVLAERRLGRLAPAARQAV